MKRTLKAVVIKKRIDMLEEKLGDFMKIAVIGCGRWGSFIAWYLDKIGNEVSLYGRESSEKNAKFFRK